MLALQKIDILPPYMHTVDLNANIQKTRIRLQVVQKSLQTLREFLAEAQLKCQ